MSEKDNCAINTDRELWRERPDDYYADSIHVTEGGGIGINCGGTVCVKPLREWHKLASTSTSPAPLEEAALRTLAREMTEVLRRVVNNGPTAETVEAVVLKRFRQVADLVAHQQAEQDAPYMKHLDDCAVWFWDSGFHGVTFSQPRINPKQQCTCGLAAIRAAASPLKEQK